ncbi:MAG: hypothetical protein JNN11_01985 [Candidatus Doudnabacteria bacterium]|nr:hypothetical protein [Candidatus Doudnabacteria bacterium]
MPALRLLLVVFLFFAAAPDALSQLRRPIPPCQGRFGDCGYNGGGYGYGAGYYGYGYGYGRPADPEAERIRRSGRAAKDQSKAFTECIKDTRKRLSDASDRDIMDACMLVAKPDQPGTAEGADQNKSVLYQNLQRSQVAAKR